MTDQIQPKEPTQKTFVVGDVVPSVAPPTIPAEPLKPARDPPPSDVPMTNE